VSAAADVASTGTAMTKPLTIVGLGGSLATTSRSRAALQVALEGAATAGAETTLLDLRELALPMYNPDDENEPPESAQLLIESCYRADGMLWSSPMYQGTISGAFKNALDWLHALGSREPPFLHDEVIGLISAAGGTQGLQAINTMEFAVRALRGWAVPYVIPVASAYRVFDPAGRITDDAVELQLRTLGAEVVRVASRFANDTTAQRARACEESAERVAAAA
jgi:FMN reductase